MIALEQPRASADDVLLAVDDLRITYGLGGERHDAVRGVSFTLRPQEAFGLVGESGCGKSTLALAIMRHLPRGGAVTNGRLTFAGEDLLALSGAALQRLRGSRLAMVYQDPGAALNPAMRVGDQIAEVFATHLHFSRKVAWFAAVEMLARVRITDPEAVARRYPHQLSGGMQQRAVIGMALAAHPALLILDEPTTGLDATVEAAVLDLLTALRQEFDTALLLISHNLAVVTRVCERVGVLYAGELVEEGATADLFATPRHPYTAALIACLPRPGATKRDDPVRPIPGSMPRLGAVVTACTFAPRCPLSSDLCTQQHPALEPAGAARLSRCFFPQEVSTLATTRPREARASAHPDAGESAPAPPLLRVDHLARRFGRGARTVHAVRDASLDLARGQIFGVVGESGSGKSTLARCVAGLLGLSGGQILLDGMDISGEVEQRAPDTVKRVQMVFQSPEATLNPRHTVREILTRTARALTARRGADLAAHVQELAQLVVLDPDLLDRYPGSLSGGQRQRVAIARAFAGDPDVVLCDEPVSALDVSVQAAILNLLTVVGQSRQVAYVFISHDLAIVRYLADWIGVMYLGLLVESGPAARVLSPPSHPYTAALFAAMPGALRDGRAPSDVAADVLAPATDVRPSGCPFHQQCPHSLGARCARELPPWQETTAGHGYRCWIPPEQLTVLQGTHGPTGDTSSMGGQREETR